MPLDVEPTLASLVAYGNAQRGRTLVGIDAALGVPRPWLLRAVAETPAWSGCASFLEWLPRAMRHPDFQREVRSADAWRWDRPFIAVPGGIGSLRAFWARAGGAPLLRRVDVRTGASSLFVVSGIPGTVGSGTRALWTELVELGARGDELAVWPFAGRLDALGARVVLCEIYPRVCYALALASALPARQLAIAKTRAAERSAAVDALLATRWLSEHGVLVTGVDRARRDEDDFDAALSAAGLLRCVLESQPLEDGTEDAVEGGILGVGALLPGGARRLPASPPRSGAARPTTAHVASLEHACPIPGCPKVFRSSRGGWDAHVASRARHPDWHPSERDPERRKALFREEFASWLA